MEDIVAHAGRKWHLLTPAKIRREMKEAREDRLERNTNRSTNQQPYERGSGDQGRDRGRDRGHDRDRGRGQRGYQGQRPRQDRQDRQPRLSSEEEQYRQENHLCFNYGRSGYQSRDYRLPHNPNRI